MRGEAKQHDERFTESCGIERATHVSFTRSIVCQFHPLCYFQAVLFLTYDVFNGRAVEIERGNEGPLQTEPRHLFFRLSPGATERRGRTLHLVRRNLFNAMPTRFNTEKRMEKSNHYIDYQHKLIYARDGRCTSTRGEVNTYAVSNLYMYVNVRLHIHLVVGERDDARGGSLWHVCGARYRDSARCCGRMDDGGGGRARIGRLARTIHTRRP